MKTIDEEIEDVFIFLSKSPGFDIGLCNQLCIRPNYGITSHWEVNWEIEENNSVLQFHKVFADLKEAVTFFVEKRHYMCLGIDFNKELEGEENV